MSDGKIRRVCGICGKELERSQQKWCSRSCTYESYRRPRPDERGENARNWKGGWRSFDFYERYIKPDRERHPDQHRARVVASWAKRSGKLKAQPCEACGTTDRVEMHHDDYSRPLDVRWLCRTHHKMLHARPEEFATITRKAA